MSWPVSVARANIFMQGLLKSMWFSVGMAAIGVILVLLPLTGAREEAFGQRLHLLILPCGYLFLFFAKYQQKKRKYSTYQSVRGDHAVDGPVNLSPRSVEVDQQTRQTVYGICLVTDIQGYTALSEPLTSGALSRLMNRYCDTVFRPIKANGGDIVQILGDSVLSLWTASGPNDGLEVQACKSAGAIIEAVDRFNTTNRGPALPTRIGIHCGYLSIGNIGAMDHFECRPVGDIVNTASRLEGLNKILGTTILVSQQVAEKQSLIETRCLGGFVFKGKTASTVVHELIGSAEEESVSQRHARTLFCKGLEAFQRRRHTEAEQLFLAVLDAIGPDGPAEFYLRQIQAYRQCLPSSHWKGVIVLDRK